MWLFAKFLIKLAIAGSILAIVAGFGGPLHPALDTFAHFRLHLAVCLVGAGLVMLAIRRWGFAACALAAGFAGIYLSATGIAYFAQTNQPLPDKPVYRLLHYNLLYNNPRQDAALSLIRSTDADFLTLTEASVLWDKKLETLSDTWPYLYHCPEWAKRGGLKIFSKHRLDGDSGHCGEYGSLALVMTTLPDGRPLQLGSVHLRWPWPASGPRQIDGHRPRLYEIGGDTILAGDFNATTWSHAVTRFAEYAGLVIWPYIGSTWLVTELPDAMRPVFGLPIDNVMYGGAVRILSATRLDPAGADHLPVLVEFQLSH